MKRFRLSRQSVSIIPADFFSRSAIALIAVFILLSFSLKLAAENKPSGDSENNNAQRIDLALTPAEQAWLKQHPVIRVGASSDFKPKLIRAADGSLSGILPDYYALLGKRLGVRFEIVDKKWADILRLPIKAQHLDMLGMINRKLAKKRGLLTLDSPYGALVTAFARKERSFQITQDNDLAGLRVAYDKDLVFLAKYFEKHKDQIDSIGVESPLDAMKLILQNKADVMVGFNHDSYLLLKNHIFDIEPVYVFQNLKIQSVLAVRADEPLLPGILEKAIDSISHAEWKRILAKWSWLPNSSETRKTINLSAREKQFLKQHPRIRFGIDASWYPFVIPQAKGPAKGLDVDLLDKINALTGANIELVAGNWSELVEQAKNRQIDGLAESSTAPSREKYFNFTDSYLSHFSALATTPERAHEFHSLGSLSDKKIAVHKGNAWVRNLLKSHQVAQFVEADDEFNTFRLVLEGKADAAVVNISTYSRLRTTYGNTFKIALMLQNDPLNVVYSIRKDWPELRSIMNKALAAIDQKAKDRLYEKWAVFSFNKPTSPISLSKEEQRWLAKNHTVRVRVVNFPPYQYIDKQTFSGISVDYLKLIGERTGVKFEFTPETRPLEEALDGIKHLQGPDLIQNMDQTYKKEAGLFYSNQYISSPRVIYTTNDMPHIHGIQDFYGKSIAAKRDSLTHHQLDKNYPMIKQQLYDSDVQALKAVSFGDADFYIGDLTLGSFLILEQSLPNMKVAGFSPFEDHAYSYGIRKDWPELVSIINKGINSITPTERAKIRSNYISINYEHTDHSAMAKWALLTGIAASGGFFLFFLWNRVLKKQVDQRTTELQDSNNLLASEITHRKQIANDLTISERKYRNLIDTSLVGIFNSTISGELLFVNDALVKMFEFDTAEQMQAEGTLPRWADLKQRDQMLALVKEHGAIHNYEAETVTRTGRHIHVLFSATLHDGVLSVMVMDITDRNRTEMALLESEQKYRATFDHADIGVIRTDLEGKFLDVNKKFCEIINYSREELINLSFPEITYTEDIQPCLDLVSQLLDGESNSFTTEKRYIQKNGDLVWVNVTATLVHDELKQPKFFVGVIEDISIRKQIEIALIKSEQKFRATFEQAAVGIAHIAPEGQFLRINQKFCDIIGYSQQEALHLTFKDITYPEDLKADLENIRQLLEGKCETVHTEKRYIHKNGALVWVHLTASLIRDEKARPLFFVAVVEDISARKQVEASLIESEQRFRGTFEQTAMGIAHVSPEGHILRINQKFCKIVGYTPDEMQKMTLLDITPADDIKFTQNNLRLLMTGDKHSIDGERQIIGKNGDLIWVHLTVALLRDAEAQPLFFIGTIEDISVRKRMEEKLREINERFKRSFDNANIAINLTKLDGGFLQTNRQMSKMYGYSEQELSTMSVKDLTHPDDLDKSLQVFKKIASGELENIRMVKRYRHKDGHTIWGNISSSIIKNSEGNPLYLIAHIMDITEHKRAEDLLKDSEARFKMIYENASIMINAADANGRMILWNKECEKVFGWSAEEVKAHPNPLELFYPDPDERQQVIELISKIHDNLSREWRPKTKDGSEVICLWANFKMNDGSTMSLGYDISERKQTEKTLQEYQQRLKSLAVQLTLAEEQERRRIAADLHDNVGQSLALTRLQLVTARKGLPKEIEKKTPLKDISQSLLKTIQDTRHLIFELSSPSLNELGLAAAIEEWMHEQIKNSFPLEFELFNYSGALSLDDDLRAILFRNVRELLINVIKHAQATSVSVLLEYKADVLLITIQDNGVGFDVARILKEEHKNRGFGLFSIEERMSDLGGSLEIESQVGIGSKSILRLPIKT